MTDEYVYYFLRSHGPIGEKILSKRRATLETIRAIGCEPVMESQIVVDHTEVDRNGFHIDGVDNESPMDARWAQIRSLERRANSRDCEAQQLDQNTEGSLKYLLSLESQALRKQAQRLKKHHVGVRTDAHVFVRFGGIQTTQMR